METGESHIVIDMVGHDADLSFCPECRAHPDCFAWMEGHCTALLNADDPCGFYKNRDENMAECHSCYQRLKDMGRTDLLRRYMQTHTALGLLDNEIREAEQYGEIFDTFRAADYQEQLEDALSGDNSDDDLLDGEPDFCEETLDAGDD